jgi:hypothetical protein
MAKRQALLFELMKDDERSDAPKSVWDLLFRKKEAAVKKSDNKVEDEVEAPIPVKADESPILPETPKVETVTAPAPVAENETNEPEEESFIGDLGKTRLYLRLNTYSLVLAVTALLVVFFCAYILGKSVGYHEGTRQRSELQLAEVQGKPAENEVLDLFPEKKVAPTPAPLPSAQTIPVNPKPVDISKNESKITRKSGLNYLIIQNFEMDAVPIAEIARKYLADHGIETSIERFGRSYKLVSVAGFEKSDPQKESFKAQIETLGQQFRQLREAYGVSFKGCYYKRWE